MIIRDDIGAALLGLLFFPRVVAAPQFFRLSIVRDFIESSLSEDPLMKVVRCRLGSPTALGKACYDSQDTPATLS